MTRFLIIIAAVILVASCRSTKQIQTAIARKDSTVTVVVDPAKMDSIRFINRMLHIIDSNRLDYTTFTAKLDIDYRGTDGKKYDVNANLRMYRDSAIWISANAVLGIEAMRVLITRDSVKMLNKLEKVYTARSVDYLQDVTALPMNLRVLQDLIIGNAVFVDSNIVSFTTTPNGVVLLSIGEWFKNLLTLHPESGSLQSSKLDDVDLVRNRTAELIYQDYENKKGVWFASKRKITVSEKKRLDISLNFRQYDFNGDVSFPFSIPRNYTMN
ncbi:MAG TPA: DUF4292 domain-containing protein [Flavisolibacter sp.]